MVALSNKLALGAGKLNIVYRIGNSCSAALKSRPLDMSIQISRQSRQHSCNLPSVLFVAGCYWGTEKYIVKDFQKKFPGAIKKAKVGFMATDPSNPLTNPSYRQVCSGTTGYVEVLYVELHDAAANFEPLVRFFFQFHDPTTPNRQGNDAGPQYGSVIFCDGPDQATVATNVKAELQQLVTAGKINKYEGKTVTTEILAMTPFVEAEEDHQEYLTKNPSGYCNHAFRFTEWPSIN